MKTYLALALLLLGSGATIRAAIESDIEYGNVAGESLRLDASVPDGAGPFPAVILVHGGGWTGGDKSGGPKKGYMVPMQDPLADAGFAWFSINYRLAPKFRHPAALEDIQTAIRWVKAHAAEYHVDPRRIALAGESAGAHLVALAAVRADDATRVAAVVPFYGLFDLEAETKRLGTLGGGIAALLGRTTLDDQTLGLMHDASPASFVKPGLPPFLFLHGTADKSVSYQESVDMLARLRRAGVSAELITIEGGPHGMLPWAALAPDFKNKVVTWLKRTLGSNSGNGATPSR